jgi:negative regulator of flagellin synthesis FlgM
MSADEGVGQDAGLDIAWFETSTHGQNQDGLASCGTSGSEGNALRVPRSIAMPDIGNIGHSIGNAGSSVSSNINAAGVRTQLDTAARRATDSASVGSRPASSDRVEVSEVARWLGEMNRLPAIREEKVAAARAAIANGSLDTDEKLAIAIGRMIDEVA